MINIYNKPIGASGYQVSILDSLTEELKETLPTVEEIEAEFAGEVQDRGQ